MNRGSKHFDLLGLIDAARGLTPTYGGFSTQVPTNLTNATDGNLDTYTGEGQETLAASDQVGYFSLDLLKTGVYLCGAKIRTSRSSGDAGTIKIDAFTKPNGTNWRKTEQIRYATATDIISDTLCFFATGQEIRLYLSCTGADGADVFSVWLYNFFAFRLK